MEKVTVDDVKELTKEDEEMFINPPTTEEPCEELEPVKETVKQKTTKASLKEENIALKESLDDLIEEHKEAVKHINEQTRYIDGLYKQLDDMNSKLNKLKGAFDIVNTHMEITALAQKEINKTINYIKTLFKEGE